MKFKNIILFILLISILSLLTSCDTTNPPSNKKLTLTAEDASCTEAWLNLKTENISLPTEIKIKQNDSTVVEANINSNDTTLFVENLLPNQTYSFQTTIKQFNNETIKSDNINVLTMDTTSHNFTWETFTFGGVNGSSYLKDVAIIDENNIWAVGEIHTEDTDKFDKDSNWVQPYNAVHWDGSDWGLKRIMFPTDADQPNGHKSAKECNSIFVFNENDFIISASVQIASYNSQNNYTIEKMGFKWEDRFTIISIWGTSSQDFYVVGLGGNIAHYHEGSWTKIESGTNLNIRDICYMPESNLKYCLAGTLGSPENSLIVKIDGSNKTIIEDLNTNRQFSSIWAKTNHSIYLSGDGTFTNKSGLWQEAFSNNRFATSEIDGNNLNDIITGGAYGLLAHNNGVSWKTYPIVIENSYTAVKLNGGIVAAVGFSGGKAAIVVGRR